MPDARLKFYVKRPGQRPYEYIGRRMMEAADAAVRIVDEQGMALVKTQHGSVDVIKMGGGQYSCNLVDLFVKKGEMEWVTEFEKAMNRG